MLKLWFASLDTHLLKGFTGLFYSNTSEKPMIHVVLCTHNVHVFGWSNKRLCKLIPCFTITGSARSLPWVWGAWHAPGSGAPIHPCTDSAAGAYLSSYLWTHLGAHGTGEDACVTAAKSGQWSVDRNTQAVLLYCCPGAQVARSIWTALAAQLLKVWVIE